MKKLLEILALIFASIANSVYSAYILTFLWLWFLTPLGIEPVGLALAYGIAITIRFLIIPHGLIELINSSSGVKKGWERLLFVVIVNTITFGFGFLLHNFI